MSERSEAATPACRDGLAPLFRILAITAALAVIGPPVESAVYVLGYICLQWSLGRQQGILDETLLSFIQAIYSFAAAPAALIGAAISLWREWWGSASWLFVLRVAIAVGVANIGYDLLSIPAEAHDVSIAMTVVVHAITWGIGGLLCWAMVSRMGARWLLTGKALA